MWIGKHICYYLATMKRDRTLDGPYTGIVAGISSNESIIEDPLEGHTHRSSVDFTGTLIVKPDHMANEFEWVSYLHADILDT